MPGTIAASRTCGSGTNTRLTPRWDAAITMGSTPGTERRPPDSVSSPMKTVSWRAEAGTSASAALIATAIARSKWVPLLGRSAGPRRMVTRRVDGQASIELAMAIRTRSRASLSVASGRPTTVIPTMPCETSAWTSIRCPTDP